MPSAASRNHDLPRLLIVLINPLSGPPVSKCIRFAAQVPSSINLKKPSISKIVTKSYGAYPKGFMSAPKQVA
jgi:hypothetical protein